ncbi:sigma-70 family RNA polymerase sigma factor [Bacteroides sp. 519]|nr:sigma-70 family RNA polymerase sigma factor [Bacteroides sp. 519]NDV59803.1 sigma-70 family RNA polymerase sigma factor [Bacteroides sp. 519]
MENEIELIKGCRAGDNLARKKLYTLFSKQMLAICYRYTGDMDAAHDVLHDGFIKIFTNFSFRGESALSTWITRVMITQSLDYLRKQQRISKVITYEEEIPEAVDWSSAEDYDNISEEQLLVFIAELPEGCRTVFNLFVLEGKSHREIAEILNIKEHSSTSQLHRAKGLLMQKINEYKRNEERE